MKVIDVKHLTKKYGTVIAVDDISFSVEEGEFFAFLGPNGAGKSTTIDILCTLISSDEGEVYINSHKVGANDFMIRKGIGIVYQNSVLDDLLTVRENLLFRGAMYRYKKEKLKERIDFVSSITEITEFIDRRYGQLSGGQKRRVDIARALLHEPKILFLDEPTTGLDPKTRQSIWSCILKMKKELGTTIFLTTHYMDEALNCDNIVVINKGKIVESNTPAKLREKYTKDRLILYSPTKEVFEYLTVSNIEFDNSSDRLTIILESSDMALKILNDVSDGIESFEVKKGNMDDAFLNIVERSSYNEIND